MLGLPILYDADGSRSCPGTEFSVRYTCVVPATTPAMWCRETKGVGMARREPVRVTWKQQGLLFEAQTDHGTIALASGLDEPGSGVTPMETLAVSLASCTAMDVASILIKMRQPLEGFSVEVSGEQAEEHPRRFTSLEILYRLKGELDERKVERAIALSEERYCSVQATLRPSVPISHRYEIER
jgi:putative redox protein